VFRFAIPCDGILVSTQKVIQEALQKPGFFKEFLGGQVFRGRKPIKRYTCPQANLPNNKITKKDSFLKSFLWYPHKK
jgi:hypothetical protein